MCLNILTPLTFCAFSKLNPQNQASYKIVPPLPPPGHNKQSVPKGVFSEIFPPRVWIFFRTTLLMGNHNESNVCKYPKRSSWMIKLTLTIIALGRLSLKKYFTKLEQYFREMLLSRGS